MVYCGKPSKGCAQCRAKRTKCDQLKPSCSQCKRAHRKCAGYRDEQELMFRDQSQAVAVRALKNNISLSIPLEDQAICFFNHNYLGWSWRSNIQENTALSTVISSVGMAGISNIRHIPEIKSTSRQRYSTALRLTNDALLDPKEAVKDQTLFAVILLGVYENISCDTPMSMVSWTHHVKGAIALLKLRSEERLRDPVGIGMFLHVRHNIVVSCLQRRVHVPQVILEWSRMVREYCPVQEQIVCDFFELAARLCGLRALTREFGWEDLDLIITTALNLDSDLDNWLLNLPSSYTFDLDFQKNVEVIGILNNYRAHRLLVNEILLRCATTEELLAPSNIFQTAKANVKSLASDICASGPFFKSSKQQHLRSGDGNVLMWPLYIAAVLMHVPSNLREDAIRQLGSIGEKMGIYQATILSNVLREQREITIWETLLTEEQDGRLDW